MGAAVFIYDATDGNGVPLNAARMNTYAKGTTTPRVVYTDSALTTPATNPVIADSAGRFRVYLNDALDYTLEVRSPDNATRRLQVDYTAGASVPFIATYQPLDGFSDWLQTIEGLEDDIRVVAENDADISVNAANISDINTVADALNAGALDDDAGTLNGQNGAYYRARSNHTGTQAASTIDGLATVATSGNAADLTGTMSVNRFNSGTNASSTTYLRGDGTWQTPAGGGGGPANTDALTEGSTNLYFTNTRAVGAVTAAPGYLRYRKTLAGLVAPGSGDKAAAITAALAALDPREYVDGQNITYECYGGLIIPKGLVLENWRLDITGASASAFAVTANGSIGAARNVTGSISVHGYEFALSDVSGLARGDTILFISDDVFAHVWNGSAWVANVSKVTWLTTIERISGSNVRLTQAYPSMFSMTTNVKAHKVTPVQGLKLYNFDMFCADDATNRKGLNLLYCVDYEIEGGKSENIRDRARQHYRCLNGLITRTRVLGSDLEGIGYGDVTGGASGVTFINNRYDDCRHGVAVGGEDGVDRAVHIIGNVMRGCRAAGADNHPGTEDCRIEQNDIEASSLHRVVTDGGFVGGREGIVHQGANGIVRGNIISGVAGDATLAGAAILVQPSTNLTFDRVTCCDNHIGRIAGTHFQGIFVQPQKQAGSISHSQINGNDIHATNYGSAGNPSPVGIDIEANTFGVAQRFDRIVCADNNINARAPALRLKTAGTGYINKVSVSGSYESLNNDTAVIDVQAAAAGYIERVDISANCFGGAWGIRNTNGARIGRSGGIITGYATAAYSGTVTETLISA